MADRILSNRFFVILCVFLFNVVFGSQEVFVAHTPSYVSFMKNAGAIGASELPEIVSTALGLPTQSIEWTGLKEGNPFHRPKANVMFTIPGFNDNTQLNIKHHVKFPVKKDDMAVSSESLVDNIQNTFFERSPLIVDLRADNTMLDIQSQHPMLFKDIPATFSSLEDALIDPSSVALKENIGTLNTSNRADMLLLGELEVIRQIVEKVKGESSVKDNTPDVFNFNIEGFQALVQEYGAESTQVKDALKLIQGFLEKMTEEFKILYNKNVLVEIVTLSGGVPARTLVRKSRDILQAASELPKINLTDDVDPNYAVIFNIILWLGIILIISLFAISYGIWGMDPGRDSIIYRMTSQRMKKE
ncbi:unnamed protein product [Owenia fusiformis]|uniref:Renin receptor n=1 Tax=Owenia fusiformis TaxID=6347 RepID=A0A8J1UAD5_OWEFU|nr:unnamed protein product [Owenia fusiformis]